jgi:tetratricopeptide (TPR) repeat protein
MGARMLRSSRLSLTLGLPLLLYSAAPMPGQQSLAAKANQEPPTATSPAQVPLASLPSPLTEALALYRKGSFDEAITKYQDVLHDKPNSPDAYAGLIRTYLKKKDVQQASDTAQQALKIADAAPVRVALGEVYFRQGNIHDAEEEWVKVIKAGNPNARAYLGIARVRLAISLYKSAWTMIDKAHALDPSDPDISRLWTARLSTADRIKYLEGYLAGENNEDADSLSAMRQYLEYLKARTKDARRSCHLVSKVSATETPLLRLLRDPQHLRGYGLAVDVNGHGSRLLLDTGASGILISRGIAEKAGVTRLSNAEISGIGDKGGKDGYAAIADSLKIGDLEFQGCTVHVLEQRSVVGEDGLIGADVFSSFLVDIDFPNEKLRLSELPKRPDDASANLSLQTDNEDSGSQNEDASKTTDGASAKADKPKHTGPQDRYIAPEMKSYSPVFRFGHMLLVPTSIGDVAGKLFLLDSGAFTNHITPAAAREVTKVHGDSRVTIKGLSGSVKNVYSADKAVLQFGHLRQENQDMLAFDFTRISDNIGTEISGTLGFTLLRFLDIKLDYRDGLVDFTYDAKRWGR